MRLLRPALATLGALSPELGASMAERMFLTAPRHPQPPHEAAALATARREIIDSGGSPITTWTWGRGPAVLLVHGWGGRGGQLAGFAPALVASGYSVITFDAPGHGTSPEPTSSVLAFIDAIRAVDRALGPVRSVIAHSIGAAATAGALRAGLGADGAVFLAPPSNLTLHADLALETLGFGSRVRTRMRERVEQRLGVPWSTLDVTGFAAEMRTPLLVVHDRDDVEVPWQEGAMIAQAWPGATLVTTSGLGHRRLVRDPGVVAGVTAFALQHLRRPVRERADREVLVSSVA